MEKDKKTANAVSTAEVVEASNGANVKQVAKIPFKAQVVERSFTQDDGEERFYLAIEMLDPLGEDLDPIVLSFERDKGYSNGRKVKDIIGLKKKGIYMHYVKKACNVSEVVYLTGEVTRRCFKDKKRKIVEYVAVDLNNLHDEQKTRVYINDVGTKALFESLVQVRLELLHDDMTLGE